MRVIPYGQQDISEDDIRVVEDVLRSEWLTQGPAIERFERTVAEYCGARHAVAVCNATAALHLACRALNLGPGDWLWTSPNTFVASANCARYCGADVDFVDIDARTSNMSVEALEQKLKWAEREGRLPKIVVPVHFAGEPCDMRSIHDLAQRYKFYIIEDAAHAIGARYGEDRVGSCIYSDITIFSFHPVKIITTAEGGMCVTRDQRLFERMALLRSHGITRAPERLTKPAEGAWYYEQLDLGYNYRMTDVQAALGASQMRRIALFVTRRHQLAARYDSALKNLPLTLPVRSAKNYSALHLYVVRLQADKVKKTRRELFDELRGVGIGVNVHYIPVHLQPYYQAYGFRRGDFPMAEKHYETCLSLPLYYGLGEEDQDHVIEALQKGLA